MMRLPASIESALLDAGFTATEILILNRLLEDGSSTIRQLSLKTGKSTGVLDQAMKKLLKKQIVHRETVNETPQYTLGSLEAVVKRMEEDMEAKREMLLRRYENFEAFVSSISHTRGRPEMRFFDGEEGVARAYVQLLDLHKELLHYVPTMHREEEDPLRAFRVQYFRERRRRGVFSRMIAHDTPLGRRFQSRDAFEYRQTKLIPPEDCPITFEKVIAGDTVACIDTTKMSACFIRFPELAESEKMLFEVLWRGRSSKVPEEAISPAAPIEVPLRTRTLSQMREFFLSRTSLITFAVFGIISAALTYGLYRHNVYLNMQRVRERVESIAATAAVQFEVEKLRKIQGREDIATIEYASVIRQLNQIRDSNVGVKYIYLMRPTNNPTNWSFIADADSLNPSESKDLNQDGRVDEQDALVFPGDNYDVSNFEEAEQVLKGHAVADDEPFIDQWGIFISAHAPIKGTSGVEAIVGVDVAAEDVYKLSSSTFIPSYYFFLLLLIFIGIRVWLNIKFHLFDSTI